MIKQTQTSKKSFYKYKLNLLEKYIASKTIQKRTRPSQVNLQQRIVFTQSVPNQESYFVKFKPSSQQRSSEARSHTKKNTERYPDSIFMKEDLIKLGKINDDSRNENKVTKISMLLKKLINHTKKNTERYPDSIFMKEDLIKLGKINDDSRNENKVTKISMLLKKLINQQVHTQNLKTQSDKENFHQNRTPLQKNLHSIRSEEIPNFFRRNSKLNFKLVEQNQTNLKNQKQQEHSLYNTTNRKNHVRYASTATKLKLKYKTVENDCLGTLKVFKCETKQTNVENYQKTRKKPSTSNQNSPREETKIDFNGKDQAKTIKQEYQKKMPKMATYRLSQSQKMPIEPWSNHQIILSDPNQMIE